MQTTITERFKVSQEQPENIYSLMVPSWNNDRTNQVLKLIEHSTGIDKTQVNLFDLEQLLLKLEAYNTFKHTYYIYFEHVEVELITKTVECIYEVAEFELGMFYKAEILAGMWAINGCSFPIEQFNKHFS